MKRFFTYKASERSFTELFLSHENEKIFNADFDTNFFRIDNLQGTRSRNRNKQYGQSTIKEWRNF